MDHPDRETRPSTWFLGDLDDPWVVAIADELPRSSHRLHTPGDLPELETTPGDLVLHRSAFTARDAEWLARLRERPDPPTRVVLCFGPHVRYADLDRWSDRFDVSIPEATARETIARRLATSADLPDRRPVAGSRSGSGPGSRPRVTIAGANLALRQMLVDGCEAAGYSVSSVRDWNEIRTNGLVVWDVPVLESDWQEALSSRSRSNPWIALIGFADRLLVAEARSRGALACLELPLELADLIALIDRWNAPRAEPAHELPPSPASRRRSIPHRRVSGSDRDV